MLIALLALALAQAPPPREKPDTITMTRGNQAWDLDWEDAEDRLHGTIRPTDPAVGTDVELSVTVGTVQAPTDFDGPITASLRCERWSETRTVTRGKGERAWFAKFTPQTDGDCALDLGFTTSRHKLLHAKLYVVPAPLSRAPWYVLLGLGAIVALALGLRAVFKKSES